MTYYIHIYPGIALPIFFFRYMYMLMYYIYIYYQVHGVSDPYSGGKNKNDDFKKIVLISLSLSLSIMASEMKT